MRNTMFLALVIAALAFMIHRDLDHFKMILSIQLARSPKLYSSYSALKVGIVRILVVSLQ